MTPKVRFLNQKIKSKAVSTTSVLAEPEDSNKENDFVVSTNKLDTIALKDEETDDDLLRAADTSNEGDVKSSEITEIMYAPLYMFPVAQKYMLILLSDNTTLIALYHIGSRLVFLVSKLPRQMDISHKI